MFSFMMVCALLVATQIQFRYLSPKQVLSFSSMTNWPCEMRKWILATLCYHFSLFWVAMWDQASYKIQQSNVFIFQADIPLGTKTGPGGPQGKVSYISSKFLSFKRKIKIKGTPNALDLMFNLMEHFHFLSQSLNVISRWLTKCKRIWNSSWCLKGVPLRSRVL